MDIEVYRCCLWILLLFAEWNGGVTAGYSCDSDERLGEPDRKSRGGIFFLLLQ